MSKPELETFTTVKNKTIYGVKWCIGGKSNISGGNSLSYTTTMSKQTNKLKLFKIHHQKEGWGWAVLEEDKIYNLVKENNSNICEVLSQYPKKVYFDIDDKEAVLKLDDIKSIINEYFPNERMAVSGYETNEKHSYHIILPDVILEDNEDLKTLKKIVKLMKEKCKYIDNRVYNNNNNFKCIHQSKPDKPKQEIIEDTNYKNHFVCSFLTGNEKKIKPMYDEEEVEQIEIDYDDIPKLNLQLPNNFKNEDIENDIKLLKMAPIDETFGHSYVWRVALFCYWNGLGFDKFWEWASKKKGNISGEYDQERRKRKWQHHFETIASQDYKKCGSRKNFIKLLSNFYPELIEVKRASNLYTKEFIKTFDLSGYVKSEEITTKYIELDSFEAIEKVLIFNIGMGGGKTYQTINFLRNKENFIWITPRISLAYNTNKRFQKLVQMDTTLYDDCGNYKEEIIKNINKASGLIIQTESLFKIQNPKKYEYVIIDEFESVLKNWDSDTHGKNIEQNFNNFKDIFQSANKIILLDAFTTTHTLEFLNSIGIQNEDIIVYTSLYKAPPKKVIQNTDYESTLNKMVKDLKDNKKLFVFYAFKGGNKNHYSIEELKDYLKKETGKRIFSFHASKGDKIKKEFTQDADNQWCNYDCIITTTSITVGVNYEKEDYDKIYLMCSGYVNNPRDIIQSSMRIRKTKEDIIETFFFDTLDKEELKYPNYYIEGEDEIYKNVIKNIRIEKKSNFRDTFIKFCELTGYDFKEFKRNEIKKKKDKFINKMFQSKMLMPYNKIDEVNKEDIEYMEKMVWKKQATGYDKFVISRFYFDCKFHKLSNEDREYIWNNRTETFFKAMKNELVEIITKDNKLNNFFELDLNKKSFELSKEAIDNIKKYFGDDGDFKNKKQKVKNILNKIFNFNIINTKTKNKNTTYEFSENFLEMIKIYKNYDNLEIKDEVDFIDE